MADQVYDLTQTGAQVQSIINDANKVMGAGSQSTLTTDSILLKDTSGNYHKIDKSSFTEAVRNTMASLLVNNDKGTTISQIAAIASGDFGSVTPANLASVLGANGNFATQIPNNSNLNDIYAAGRYCCMSSGDASTIQNVPVQAGFTMLVYSTNSSDTINLPPASKRLSQDIYPNSSPGSFYRRTWNGSIWSAWFLYSGTSQV